MSIRAVFIEFTSQQAATAVKKYIESFSTQPAFMAKRHQVNFTSPHTNPFRTLPKDAPTRNKEAAGRSRDAPMSERSQSHSSGPPNMPPVNMGMSNMGGGPMNMSPSSGPAMNNAFRGTRTGFGTGPARGGNLGTGFMGPRGPNAPMGGQGSPQNTFQQPMGFGGPNMPMPQFGAGNFQANRGGMGPMIRGGPQGVRGARGGMMGGPMGGPMSSPGMMGGGMGGGMGMGGMGNMAGPMGTGGMDGGFSMMPSFNPMMGKYSNNSKKRPAPAPNSGTGGGPTAYPTPHFNPAFFPNNQPQQWNDPHDRAPKRPRPNE